MSFNRREKIITMLRENGVVMLKDLEKEFPDVSSMTIRRDLEFFEKLGEVIRIRGGAKYIKDIDNKHDYEDVYALRAIKNHEAKELIARNALSYIETGRSIFIDSGSTAMCLARLMNDHGYSIITSGPNIAMEVSKRYKPTVTLIGGIINRATFSTFGMQSMDFIKGLNIDTAIMVASACSEDGGFSCGNYNDAEMKKAIISKAKQVIILADNSKFEKSMPFTFASLKDVNVIVTNKKPSDDMLNLFNRYDIKTIW